MNDIKGTLVTINKDITADMICSPEYQTESDPVQLAGHVFENIGNGFPKRLADASILVAGSGFGHDAVSDLPVRALQAAGIKCIIASDYDRGFFRIGINNGLALIEADILEKVSDGDTISLSLSRGKIACNEEEISFASYPEQVCSIIENGGLLQAVKAQLGKV
ncbi:MAG: hypothetical protein DRP47_00975 [Candidatus Zixiibacteriota bacterium]|nr:MAG: hypothetical protein DRP47_00975 [candidate division Zixibacteria bacterium]